MVVTCCINFHVFADARLFETVRKHRRELLQDMLQRLHKQGAVIKRGISGWWNSDLGVSNTSGFQEGCVMNCTEKFLKHSERVGSRFAELNAGAVLAIRREYSLILMKQTQWVRPRKTRNASNPVFTYLLFLLIYPSLHIISPPTLRGHLEAAQQRQLSLKVTSLCIYWTPLPRPIRYIGQLKGAVEHGAPSRTR